MGASSATGPVRWARNLSLKLLGERLLDVPWLYRGDGIDSVRSWFAIESIAGGAYGACARGLFVLHHTCWRGAGSQRKAAAPSASIPAMVNITAA